MRRFYALLGLPFVLLAACNTDSPDAPSAARSTALASPTATLFSSLHPVTPVAPNVTRHVVDGSSSPSSYTRLTINPGKGKDLFTLTRVPIQ